MSKEMHPDVLQSIQSHYLQRLKDGDALTPEELEELFKMQNILMDGYYATIERGALEARSLLEGIQAEYKIMTAFLEQQGLVREYDVFRWKQKHPNNLE